MTVRFGDLLQAERKHQRISQSKLADLAGFDHSFVSRLESGTRVPSRDAVMRLVAALRLPLEGNSAQALIRSAGFVTEDDGNAIYPEYTVVTRLNNALSNPLLMNTDRELVIDAVDAILGLAFVRTMNAGQ